MELLRYVNISVSTIAHTHACVITNNGHNKNSEDKLNHLTWKWAYKYGKVLITVCSTSVVTTAITLHFEKER